MEEKATIQITVTRDEFDAARTLMGLADKNTKLNADQANKVWEAMTNEPLDLTGTLKCGDEEMEQLHLAIQYLQFVSPQKKQTSNP